MAQLAARRLAVRQARVRCGEVLPTELTSDEEMERDPGDWRRMNELYECDSMSVCYKI